MKSMSSAAGWTCLRRSLCALMSIALLSALMPLLITERLLRDSDDENPSSPATGQDFSAVARRPWLVPITCWRNGSSLSSSAFTSWPDVTTKVKTTATRNRRKTITSVISGRYQTRCCPGWLWNIQEKDLFLSVFLHPRGRLTREAVGSSWVVVVVAVKFRTISTPPCGTGVVRGFALWTLLRTSELLTYETGIKRNLGINAYRPTHPIKHRFIQEDYIKKNIK